MRPLKPLLVAAGLITLAVVPGLIAVRETPTAPSPYAAEDPALPPLVGPGEAEPARPAPRETAAQARSPEEQRVLAEAQRVLREALESDRELPRDWRADYEAESDLVLSSTPRGRWVTISAARVPCDRVDRTLARKGGRLGEADRCRRWIERTRQVLLRHGVQRDPREFLEEQRVDTGVRVLVVYAGWVRDGDDVRLVEARAAPVYPEIAFDDRRRGALGEVYRALDLGPYARE